MMNQYKTVCLTFMHHFILERLLRKKKSIETFSLFTLKLPKNLFCETNKKEMEKSSVVNQQGDVWQHVKI